MMSALRKTASQDTATRCDIAAYMFTDRGAALAREVGQLVDDGGAVLHGGGLSAAARVSMGTPLAQTVLAELGQLSMEEACESVAEISKSGSRVIVVGDRDDLKTFRALIRAGAQDYLAFPVSAADVLAANDNLPSAAPAALPGATTRSQHRIGILGCVGGVGASLLAQNLAHYLASGKGPDLRTALLDADLRFGTQAIDLDRNDTPGLQEALSAPDRVDATLLGATMEKVSERLSLYSHQPQLALQRASHAEALPTLIEALSETFEAVVIDMPRAELADHPQIAATFDTLVPVLPCGYAGVNATTRLLGHIREHAPDLTVLPVLSEFRQDAGLSRKDIAKAIGMDICQVLPKSEKALRRAHRAAAPLITSHARSPYARAVRGLWTQSLAAQEERPKGKSAKRGLLRRVFA